MPDTIPVTPNTATTPESFAVIGAGTWGLTLADLLARNGHTVSCWDHNADLVHKLDDSREHPNLAGFKLDPAVEMQTDLAAALSNAKHVVIVVPSMAMRPVGESIKATNAWQHIETWIICTKGIEAESLMLMSDVLEDVLGPDSRKNIGVLSGPSHAEEVCNGLPTTISAAAHDPARAELIQQWFFRPYFRVYTIEDMVGVELGAAVKNVIAIAAGGSDGIDFGDNAKAALITRGLAEIARLGASMGARPETFMGLAGIGDLIVTATSRHSRNYRFGRLLAEGKTPEAAQQQIGMVVEGYHTAYSLHQLAQRQQIDMPIAQAIYRILYEGLSVQDGVKSLLQREPKPEMY